MTESLKSDNFQIVTGTEIVISVWPHDYKNLHLQIFNLTTFHQVISENCDLCVIPYKSPFTTLI